MLLFQMFYVCIKIITGSPRPMTIGWATIQSYGSAEWMVVITTSWSSGRPSTHAVMWMQPRHLTTCVLLNGCQVPCNHASPFAIFPAIFSRKSMRKPAGKVAGHWGKSPPPVSLHLCHANYLGTLANPPQPLLHLPHTIAYPSCTSCFLTVPCTPPQSMLSHILFSNYASCASLRTLPNQCLLCPFLTCTPLAYPLMQPAWAAPHPSCILAPSHFLSHTAATTYLLACQPGTCRLLPAFPLTLAVGS